MTLKITLNLGIVALAIGLVGGAVWLGMGWQVVQQREIRERAVQGCLEVGYEEYVNEEQGSRAVTVNKQSYEYCMQQKGMETVK